MKKLITKSFFIIAIAICMPASLFVSADSLYDSDVLENKTIISEITSPNPLRPGELKNETTTTVYDNNITETSVLIVSVPKGKASGTREASHTKYVRRTNDNAFVASFTLNASWSYNSTKGTVTRDSYSSSKTAGAAYTISTFKTFTESGDKGAWWSAWSNVKANYYVYNNYTPMSFWDGSVEIKCDSNGNVSTTD